MGIPLATSTPTKCIGAAMHLCADCGRCYRHVRGLRKHSRKKHPTADDKPMFTCHDCTKVFYDTIDFQSHINRHACVKPFQCTICNSKFANKRCLSCHVCANVAKETLVVRQCEECGSKKILLQHMRSYDSTPPMVQMPI